MPFWLISIVIIVGIGGIWLALQTHWAEDRERLWIQIHQWALDEEREILKQAAMTPMLWKGYRMAGSDAFAKQREYNRLQSAIIDQIVMPPESK